MRPVLFIFEGLCPELTAGCSNCTVTVAGEWQAAFSYRQKRKHPDFTYCKSPASRRPSSCVWFKETRSGYIFVSKYHSILQDRRYILGPTLFLRSWVVAMYKANCFDDPWVLFQPPGRPRPISILPQTRWDWLPNGLGDKCHNSQCSQFQNACQMSQISRWFGFCSFDGAQKGSVSVSIFSMESEHYIKCFFLNDDFKQMVELGTHNFPQSFTNSRRFSEFFIMWKSMSLRFCRIFKICENFFCNFEKIHPQLGVSEIDDSWQLGGFCLAIPKITKKWKHKSSQKKTAMCKPPSEGVATSIRRSFFAEPVWTMMVFSMDRETRSFRVGSHS